jgi:hypothetical protein
VWTPYLGTKYQKNQHPILTFISKTFFTLWHVNLNDQVHAHFKIIFHENGLKICTSMPCTMATNNVTEYFHFCGKCFIFHFEVHNKGVPYEGSTINTM